MRGEEILSNIDWHPDVSQDRRREIEDAILHLDRKVHGTNRPILSEAQMFGRMRNHSAGYPSMLAWSKSMGVGKSYGHDVLSAKRPPSESMLRRMGLRRIRKTFYEEI